MDQCSVKAARDGDASGQSALPVAARLGNADSGIHLQGGDEESGMMEKSNESNQMQNGILVMATLIITLTYQAMANPSSTFLKEGSTRIDWECLNKGASHGLIKRFKDCPALLALLFMIFNTFIFILSISVVLFTLRMRGSTILLLFLVRLLTLFLVFCYTFLLAAFYYNAVYVALPFALIALGLFLFTSIDEENPGPLIMVVFRILFHAIRGDPAGLLRSMIDI